MEKRLKVVRCCYQGDNGYTILLCDEVAKGGKAITCSLTCVGYFLPTTANRIMTAELEEVENKKYGKQYNVKHFEAEDPKDKIGMIDVILSCKLKGIGKKKAERIVEQYGSNTFNVLDNDFMRIRELKHMPKDLETPMTQWKNSRDLREMIAMVGNNVNVSQKKLLKIRSYFKEKALEVLRNKPYQVMEIHGIDFYTADSIAYNCNDYTFFYNDIQRIKAGVKQSLLDGMLEGHLYLFTSQIITKASSILMYEGKRVSAEEIKKALNDLVKLGEVVFLRFTTDIAFYLKSNYEAEQSSAEKITKMVCEGKSKPDKEYEEKILASICKHEKAEGINLADKQKMAVFNALMYPVSIITGGPGRGKTTVINTILNVYKEFYPQNSIALMAPTGRAARRMSEMTGMSANTIHSALCIYADEEKNPENFELDAELVIVDEMSMVDMKIFSILCSSIKKGCKLIMVGDKDQLSSVGAGNVFAELISSTIIPTTVLDTPFRQNENDLVFINAEKINKGDTKLLEGVTFKFVVTSGEEEIRDKCLSCYQSSLLANNNELDSIFLLSPFRRRTSIGSDQLNMSLQKIVNKNVNCLVVKVYGKSFRKGDKVMQNKNFTDDTGLCLSNGDIGYITDVCVGTENDSSVTVEFEGIGIKEYSGRDDFEMLELAYATTVHKSQGSEADTVIIPMSNIFSVMLKRNLVYTAVSRAKKNVIVVGDKNAFYKAILNDCYDIRNTILGWRLQQERKKYVKDKGEDEFHQLSFV